MDGQTALLQLFGDIRVTDILVFILALGYLVPQAKKGYQWLIGYLRQTEQEERVLGDAAKLPDYHQQSIDIRNKLQKQIEGMQQDIAAIKALQKDNDALRLGVQALLRDNIIATYNKYHEKGYIPIYARESLAKEYSAYEGLGGNDVAHSVYKTTMDLPTDPPTSPDGKEVNEDE